jgi:hypothetical protein
MSFVLYELPMLPNLYNRSRSKVMHCIGQVMTEDEP